MGNANAEVERLSRELAECQRAYHELSLDVIEHIHDILGDGEDHADESLALAFLRLENFIQAQRRGGQGQGANENKARKLAG